jgi:hypothetical protein
MAEWVKQPARHSLERMSMEMSSTSITGALMVALGKMAVSTSSHSRISEDETLALTEKFDRNAIETAAQAKWLARAARPRPRNGLASFPAIGNLSGCDPCSPLVRNGA